MTEERIRKQSKDEKDLSEVKHTNIDTYVFTVINSTRRCCGQQLPKQSVELTVQLDVVHLLIIRNLVSIRIKKELKYENMIGGTNAVEFEVWQKKNNNKQTDN